MPTTIRFTTGDLPPARSRGKCSPGVALVLSLIAAPAFALNGNALPNGGAVGAGSASLAQNGAINWQSFNIGANATVNFVQPNRSAIALNRVVGSDGSTVSYTIITTLGAAGSATGMDFS